MNKETPKLSIITACYNNCEGLRKTMESVKAQTFTDYEYIVIDGGSTDGTVGLLRENEQYIDYWVSEKDSGIYNAMNKGIKIAKGEYCYFLNSDDYIAVPNTLEKIFERVKDSPDIIYGNLAIRKGERLHNVIKFSKNITPYSFYRFRSPIHHQASFTKRELFEKYGGYDEDIPIIADMCFFYNAVISNGVKTQYINKVFAVFAAGGISYNCGVEAGTKAMQARNELLETTNSPDTHLKMLKKVKKNNGKIPLFFSKVMYKLYLLVWIIVLKLSNEKVIL